MKYIITEEQHTRVQIVRRLDKIWELIQNSHSYIYPCDFRSLGHFLIGLKFELHLWDVNWFTAKNEDEAWDMIMKIHGEKIIDNYNEKCKGK